jgi:SagB-type dehydrogenase family enzyme
MLSKTRFRHDVSFLVSVGLLVAGATAGVTGWISDLWNLNDFFYHRYAGYLMAVLAMAHVVLYWRQMVAYARWRVGGGRKPRQSTDEVRPTGSAPGFGQVLRVPLTRRGFVGLLFGGLAGLGVGRSLNSQPALAYGSDVSEIYHEWSKPKLLSLLGTVADWGRQPDQYKAYAGAEQVTLPPPGQHRGLSTEEAIEQRRSVREFSGQPMALQELSRLLYYVGGINTERWGHKLRAAPSAGALYPIEIYPVIHRVEGLRPGLYHYAVQNHALDLLHTGDLRARITRDGLMQEFLGEANVVLVLTAIFQRLRWKYQERSYRYALLEAGHLAQNAYLAATSMGMGACAVGAFIDSGLNGLLGVDGTDEAAVYMLAIGKV